MAWSPISSRMETAWWTSFSSGTLGVRGNQQSLERPLYPDSGRCGRVESTTGQSGQIFVGMGGAMEAREELLPPCRACTRAMCQVFLIRLQELSARPMSRLSPRSPSGFSSGYCGLGMFVGLLMQLRSTPQFQAQHGQSSLWQRWHRRTRSYLHRRTLPWKGWRRLVSSNGKPSQACWILRTLNFCLLHIRQCCGSWRTPCSGCLASSSLSVYGMDDDLLSVELLQLPRVQVPGTGQLAQRLRRPCMWKRSKMKQALRIRPGSDQPEQVLLRAEALRKAFSQAKVTQPQGE